MIRIDPKAALEIAADEMLDAIEHAPLRFPAHPFATTPGARRAIFPSPWPYAIAHLVVDDVPFVLACEHLRRRPAHWAERLRR